MHNPKNIHCLALNFEGVGDEQHQKPLYFIKSQLTLCYDGAKVPFPAGSSSLWTEVELGIVIRKKCIDLPVNSAADYISGFIVCADLTCSNLYNRDHHLAFSKSRKNFCPMSKTIVQLDGNKLESLELITEINSKVTQRGSTSQMRYGPYRSLSYISHIVPVSPGDVILTGTPPGHENNMLERGDVVRHIIENVGELRYEII